MRTRYTAQARTETAVARRLCSAPGTPPQQRSPPQQQHRPSLADEYATEHITRGAEEKQQPDLRKTWSGQPYTPSAYL